MLCNACHSRRDGVLFVLGVWSRDEVVRVDFEA